MPIKIKDPADPTKEIEVFTQEEVSNTTSKLADEKAKAAIEAYKAQNPDKTKEIDDLKNKLADAAARLETAEGYDDGSPERKAQIERLRKERDEATTNLNTTVKTLTDKITAMEKGNIETAKSQLLDKYAGKDVEARKKVELEFENYRSNETTPDQMAVRMEKAAQLAGVTVPATPGSMDHGSGGGSRGEGNYGDTGPKKVTNNAVNVGKAIGVTKEELDKHVASKNNQQ
jgi:hypothetical protein